jgi:hypothetical protein
MNERPLLKCLEEEKHSGRVNVKYFNSEDKENISQLSNMQLPYDKENIPPSKVQRIQQVNSIPIASKSNYSDFSTHKISKSNGSIMKHFGLKKRETKKGVFMSGIGNANCDSELSNDLHGLPIQKRLRDQENQQA